MTARCKRMQLPKLRAAPERQDETLAPFADYLKVEKRGIDSGRLLEGGVRIPLRQSAKGCGPHGSRPALVRDDAVQQGYPDSSVWVGADSTATLSASFMVVR
jgi:hypothetical protein